MSDKANHTHEDSAPNSRFVSVDENAHNHSHDGHDHSHGHHHGPDGHVHENKNAVLSRLKRANGHLESVIRMVDDNRDCSEVLVQLAAVRAALNNVGKVILQDHISECITEAVISDDKQMIDELNRAIAQFIK